MKRIYVDPPERKTRRTIADIQREYGKPALDVFLEKLNHHGNVSDAAAELDFSERQLYRYVETNFQQICRWEYKPGLTIINKE